MKKFLFLLLLFTPLLKAQGATVSPPVASGTTVTLSWTSTCVQAQNCSFIPYRIIGACPSTLTGPGWTQLASTLPNVGSAVDSTVTFNTQYSYIVEATMVVSGITLFSGPSNCVSVTTPNGPSPATGLTAKTP